MFSLFHKALARSQEVEVVGYQPPWVTLRSSSPLELGEMDIRARVADIRLKARVRVLESSQEEARAEWLAPSGALPYLEELFVRRDQRGCPRFAHTLRVTSPQLSGRHGWTVDLSQQGLCFEAPGALAPGAMISLQVDLDDRSDTQLEVAGQVKWSAPALHDGWCVAGVEFRSLKTNGVAFRRYQKFLDRLAEAERPERTGQVSSSDR